MFRHRKLVVLSEDDINSFECNAWSQAFLVVCMAAVIGWGCFASYYVVKTEVKLAGALDDEEALRLKYVRVKTKEREASEEYEFLEKHNEKLEQQLSTLKHSMRDVTGLLENLGDLTDVRGVDFCKTALNTPEDMTSIAIRGEVYDDDIPNIQATLVGLEEHVDTRIDAIRQAMNKLPEKSRPPLAKAPRQIAESDEENGKGGPYIPDDVNSTPASSESVDVQLLKVKIAYLSALERNLRDVPLAAPYNKYRVTSGFGSRVDPMTKRRSGHYGLDMSAGHKAEVSSSADGKILRAGRSGAYGNMVEIQHANGFITRYAHLHAVKVKSGQKIRQGDIVGLQGNTGRSTGSHLHYEVRYRGTPVNPKHFLEASKYVF